MSRPEWVLTPEEAWKATTGNSMWNEDQKNIAVANAQASKLLKYLIANPDELVSCGKRIVSGIKFVTDLEIMLKQLETSKCPNKDEEYLVDGEDYHTDE